jgi:hypothetical protein
MTFGDVIKYKAKEYVYLAATDEIAYLAVMPNAELSRDFINRREVVFNRASKTARAAQDTIAWCFIILSTEEFKERIAHYGRSAEEYREEYFLDKIGKLNIEDQKALREEILKDNAAPGGLRDLVQDIQITD